MWRVAVVFVVVAVLVAGCGGDEGAAREDYVEAMERELVELGGEPVRDHARCVADAAVDAVGLDQLDAEAIEPVAFADHGPHSLDLDVDDDRLRDAVDECEYETWVAAAMLRPGRSAVTADSRRCVAEALAADPLFVETSVGTFASNTILDSDAVVVDTFAACPDAISQVLIAEVAGALSEVEDIRPAVLTCLRDRIRADTQRAATILLSDDLAAQDAYTTELGAACANAQ